jgi:hypothetical protein
MKTFLNWHLQRNRIFYRLRDFQGEGVQGIQPNGDTHIQGSMSDRSWELIQIYQYCRKSGCLEIRGKVWERWCLLHQVHALEVNPQSCHDPLGVVDGLFGSSPG